MNIHKIGVSFLGTKINTIYYNDLHGQTKYIDSFYEEQDSFYKSKQDETNLTLCGGDMFLDKNPNNNIVAKRLGKRTDAICAGNHDIESGNYFSSLIDKFNMKGKWLSANMNFTKPTPLKDNILKSTIIHKGNEKIGVIGVSPLDFNNISFMNNNVSFMEVDDFEKTVSDVKKEVKNLEIQNVDKIFLLAHTGERSKNGDEYYKTFAKIGGIDVIIGGHDHREVDNWETSDRGEPVRIVSTGRNEDHEFGENLDYIGELELDFDDNGVLVKNNCKNNIIKLKEYIPEHKKEDAIYVLSAPAVEGDALQGHSETGNIVADSNLWYVNKHTKGKKADFAFVNAGTLRGEFNNIYVNANDIQSIVPFTSSTLIKTELSKKQIIDTLNWSAKSTSFTKVVPGMMQVAGMEYTVNKDLSVSDVHILDDDGNVKYNLDDFDDDEKFTAVYDVFLATGPVGLDELKKDYTDSQEVENFDASRQVALTEYLKESDKIKEYHNERIHRK